MGERREGEKGTVGEIAGQLFGRKEGLEDGLGAEKVRSEEEERLRALRGGKSGK